MDEIIQLAERLGKTIADSSPAADLRAARKTMEAEPETQKLLEEYQVQSQKIAQLQAENEPIEVDDKHKFRELQEKLVACESFKKLTAAQVEYVDLMRKVDQALRGQLSETEGGQ